MLFAVDKNGDRISIDNAIISKNYFCPSCGGKLNIKKGDDKSQPFCT